MYSSNPADPALWWKSDHCPSSWRQSTRRSACLIPGKSGFSNHLFCLRTNNSSAIKHGHSLWNRIAGTFANKMATLVHKSQLFVVLVVDGFVLGEFVHSQMVNHPIELVHRQHFAKESGHFLDLTAEIPLKILVEKEKHVRMIPFWPSVQQMREEWRTVNWKCVELVSYETA